MFLPLFGRRDRPSDEPNVEMLDLEAVRTRIGAGGPRPAKRPRDAVRVRYDGRASSRRRSWRDIAGLSP